LTKINLGVKISKINNQPLKGRVGNNQKPALRLKVNLARRVNLLGWPLIATEESSERIIFLQRNRVEPRKSFVFIRKAKDFFIY